MKFVKALNQGIVTDLGLGRNQYSITIEGTEVPDDVASKLKEIFGHLVEVTDVVAPVVETVEEEAVIVPEEVVTPATEPTVEPEADLEKPLEEGEKTVEEEVQS